MGRRRTYKFTDKQHSKGGVRSSVAGAISLLCTLGGIYASYITKGNAGNYLAILGFVAIIACIYGVIAGGKSFGEEEVFYLFSRIGTIVNFLLLIFWIAVVGMGFLM